MLSRFRNTPRLVLNYLLGLLTFSAATGILYLLRDILDTPLIALLFLLPVGLNTAVWGLGPGILSALSAFLCFNYFFIRPYYTFAVHQTSDVVVLIVFFVVAVVISQLVGQAQSGQAAATARESGVKVSEHTLDVSDANQAAVAAHERDSAPVSRLSGPAPPSS